MKLTNLLKTKNLTFFSHPVSDRSVYRAIEKLKPLTIVELGVSDGVRAERMLDLARRYQSERIAYTGIDEFEGNGGELSLKEAYQKLSPMVAKVRLLPGNAFGVLKTAANNLTQTDLVVISAAATGPFLDAAWYLIPRMLTDSSLLLLQDAPETDFIAMTKSELEERALQSRPTLRAA